MSNINKRPYLLAFLLYVIGFVLGTIGYGTGFWFIADGKDRLFQRLGLWEACFNGYEHTSDYIGKKYYGCWWLFHKEYSYIRGWILPSWFIAVQTLMTFAIVTMFVTLAIFPLAAARSYSVRVLNITCFLTFFTMICEAISIVIFGVMIGEDRTWMPRPDIDSLGWSYGLVVVSSFLSAFSFISITVFTMMRKWEDLPKDDIDYGKARKIEMPPVPKI